MDALCYGACMHNGWDPRSFGKLIEDIVRVAGISQNRIAALAGVHHSQVSRWKTGMHRPDYDQIAKLAAGLSEAHPELGALAPALFRAAGYGAGFSAADQDVVSAAGSADVTRLPSSAGTGNGDRGV